MNVKRVLFCLVMMMVVGVHLHAGDGYRDESIGLSFPQKLAGFDFQKHQAYDNPDLGYSVRYQDRKLFKIDIYVYDKGYKDIGEGISSKRVAPELKEVLDTIMYLEKKGIYRNVRQLSEGTGKYGAKDVQFVSFRCRYEQTPGKDVLYYGERISDTYLTARKGKFVKVRLTFVKEELAQREKDIKDFMDGLADLMMK